MKNLEGIKTCNLFGTLSEKERTKLLSVSVQKEFERGDVIAQEGDRSSYVFIVTNGQVKGTKFTSDGREIILEVLGHCDMIGQVAAIANEPYYYTAIALTKSTVNLIKKEDFMELIRSNPGITNKTFIALGKRLRAAQIKIEEFVNDKVEQRIAKLLITLSARMGSEIPFTRQEIAGMVGTTIETTIRVTSRFKEAKVIRTTRGKIIITDKKKLGLLADGPPLEIV
ncbi:MAG: Crp/Fnr family transcriptional regulator [Candidatus Firestonebacteria bacterium]|nr:Crp/Fnr family transcriptional regulator [Candidatus Firestonebacteria bacterium]